MNYKHLSFYIVCVVSLASCGTHKRITYVQYAPKNNQKTVVVIPKEVIVEAKQVFQKVKVKAVNPRLVTLNYINEFAPLAIFEMKKHKIPASIILAQGVIESSSGQSELSLKSNNHFGIKCHENWKGNYVKYDDDKKAECFRKYDHSLGSYQDHSLFLKNRNRYAFLFKLKKDDYKAWAYGLKKAGYATDSKYPNKLIKIIEDYQLYRYDQKVLHPNKSKKNNETYRDNSANITNDSVSKVIKINHKNLLQAKTHTVKKGDTLYSLSKKYNVAIADLKLWNNLNSNNISIGQLVIVKCKF